MQKSSLYYRLWKRKVDSFVQIDTVMYSGIQKADAWCQISVKFFVMMESM